MKTFQDYLSDTGEIGFVESVTSSVVSVSGLPHAFPQEIVMFESGERGYVLALHEDIADILLFSKRLPKSGTKVARTNNVLAIGAGSHLMGSVIDPFGKVLSQFTVKKEEGKTYIPIEKHPPGIDARKRINKPLETGTAIVDMVVPLGRGQRELIIGDKKTGKSYFLLQTLLTQSKLGTLCIYVAIGKKQLTTKKIEEFIRDNGIQESCIIVASTAEDSPGVTFIAPYTGMTLAEYFRDQGRDVLLILDDLTTHARYYRQISLLMKRFPGRNSYPADIFYAHARLLERAGNFISSGNSSGEHSITCFPVAETVQGDLSGYIQTNLMSITDGHLYFDIDLFSKGRRPPIHPFLSVTRVGKQTQTTLRQTLNREILSFLSLYERMQNFSHFGSEVNESVAHTLSMGIKIDGFFDQDLTRPFNLQLLLFSLLWIDTWHDKPLEVMKQDFARITDLYLKDESIQKDIQRSIEKSDSFNRFLGELRGKPEDFYKKLGL